MALHFNFEGGYWQSCVLCHTTYKLSDLNILAMPLVAMTVFKAFTTAVVVDEFNGMVSMYNNSQLPLSMVYLES